MPYTAETGRWPPGSPTEEGAYGRTFHMTALFILLILTMAGPFITVNEHVPLSGDGNPFRQISYLIIFACVVRNYRSTKTSIFTAMPLTVLLTMAWCWLTLSWSIVPGIGIRRLTLTMIVIWTIFLAVRQARYEETLTDIRYAMLFGLLANYFAVIALPNFGIHHVQEEGGDPDLIGTWKGVMLQKNFAGAMCALTIIFHLFDTARMRKGFQVFVVLASAYFLYRTHSKTSIGMMVGSAAVGGLYLLYNPRYRAGLLIAIALVTSLALLYISAHTNLITDPLNSQGALTGRGSIWPVTYHYWRDHWKGSGYGSFWVIGNDSPVFRYGTGWVTDLGNGHNGYLDLLAEIGTPGLLLTLVAFIFWPLFRLLTSTTIARRRGALLIASLLFCAGNNMTESTLLDRDMIVHVFLTFTIAMIGVAASRVPKSSVAFQEADQPDMQQPPNILGGQPTRERAATGRRLVPVEPRYARPQPLAPT